MLFLSHKGSSIDFVFEIGNFGVGAFRFAAFEQGQFLLIGEQASKPYTDTAQFTVTQAQLESLHWGSQGFALRVLGMSAKSSAKLPLTVSAIQQGNLLQALDQSNNSLNGNAPPFSEVLLDLLTPGVPRDIAFGVYFQ
jgi:hypothetical protein